MIREFTDADVEAVVRLNAELHPHWVHSAAGLRHRLATEPAEAHARRWVADDDGEVVGLGYSGFELYAGRPGVAFVSIGVTARSRRRGLGGALWERVEAHLRELRAERLLAEGEPDDASRRFAESRGFRHTMTRRLSSVDPRTSDVSGLAALEAEKAREGFTLAPFSALRDRAHDLFELDAAASRDIPLDEPLTNFRFERWESDHLRHPDTSLDGSYAVLADGKPVSFALLRADLERRIAGNDMTGTLREYRGRGLARLAKLATIAWAAQHGITSIVTENDETNAPMLALNVSLGYRPIASMLAYVRDL